MTYDPNPDMSFEEYYELVVDFEERILRSDPSSSLASVCRKMLYDLFQERIEHDYQPFTGRIKWHSTGLIDVHGRWKIDWNDDFRKILKTATKKRFSVDPEFYSFDLIRYAYDQGYMTLEEYVENVRRKVAWENVVWKYDSN